jgi:ZIP family zinc transporter
MTAAVLATSRRLSGLSRSVGKPLRVAVGCCAASAAGVYLAMQAAQWVVGNPAVVAALEATALTAAATGLGALPLLAARRLSAAIRDTMLGFGAGAMLAASGVSLLLPAFASATALSGSATSAATLVAAGLAVGALALALLDRSVPHKHLPAKPARPSTPQVRGATLVAVAIALHNLPEGLAVGASAASGAGTAVTLAIALQNVPEGLVVATALAGLGVARGKAAGVALATGLLEPIGGVLGASLAAGSAAALPWALAAAAGAMLFVVLHEMVPQLHRPAARMRPALGAAAGIAAMILLDAIVA